MLFFRILMLYNKEVACFKSLISLVLGPSLRGRPMLAMVVSCLPVALDWRSFGGIGGESVSHHKYETHFFRNVAVLMGGFSSSPS